MSFCGQCGEELTAGHECSLVPQEALQAGDMVGEYRVEKKLGEGGMGAVFAGVHPRIGKRVAIKVLNQTMSAHPQIVTRFENEARAVNAIGHRNIVDIFSFGSLPDGSPYFVMEWLVGQDMDEFIKEKERLSLGELMPILRQVCRALDAAHQKEIIHRDLKPENIFLTPDEDGGHFVKLLDFGIAKFHGDAAAETQTRAGSMMGTPHFMSPEQALGQEIDHRTDIYAMAILLYRALTGNFPFDGPAMAIISAHLSTEPTPPQDQNPEIDDKLNAFVLRNLAKDPEARHQTILAFLEGLEDCLGASSQPPQRPASSNSLGTASTDPLGTSPASAATDSFAKGPTQAAMDVASPKSKAFPMAIAAVAVLGLGAGAFFALGGKDDKSKEPVATEPGTGGTSANDAKLMELVELPPTRGYKRGGEYHSISEPSRSK